MKDKQRPDSLDELLPWYVTGTLNEADTDAVEAALAARANAAALVNDEAELSRRIAGAHIGLDGVLARQSDAFERLRERLHQPTEPAPAPAEHTARGRMWAAALSMLLVVTVATAPWLTPEQPAGSFTTLTGSSASGSVQLVVTAEVAPAQVRHLAERIDATVVAGPTPHNVYLIALRPGSDTAQVAAWLRKQPGVSFVGPAD